VRTALVVGGGIAGTTLAGELQHQGVQVHVVEREPEPTFRGIGIALLPPTLRAMHELGLADECVERGFPQRWVRTCNVDGDVIGTGELHGLLPAPYPPAVGISRTTFGEILRQRAIAAGAELEYRTTVVAVHSRDDFVDVELSDGTVRRYDLVVGADGLRSAVRAVVFPEEPPPSYIGQWAWRVLTRRPDELQGQMLFLGSTTRAGFNPISEEWMYVYVLHPTDDARAHPSPDQSFALLVDLLSEYGGAMREARARLTPDDPSFYGPLFTTFVPGAWHRGRVILIGDAAHATPPHLASGAGIAIEDAIVLARCLREHDQLGHAFDEFMARRYERCRTVVENSRTLSGWDLDNDASPDRAATLLAETFELLSQPI
jgi:2-polyprenyl-6-methoxyphenol hydroxylase-like FAD-dependent oxidoreductase